MSKATIIPVLALVLVGAFIVFYNSKPVPSPAQSSLSTEETQAKWESKTDDQGSVTVTVTPVAIDLSSQTTEWKFDIVLNTHSVELDQNMIQIAVLVDDAGKEYKPLRWEGTEAGGHHREGTLVFAPISPYPRYLRLIIKSVGEVERLFSWTLIEQ